MTGRTTEHSHRHILRATSLIGGATVAALVIGLARNKAIALIAGPEAIGLLGIYTAIMTTATALAVVNLDTSLTRVLVPRTGEPEKAAHIRRAAWLLALVLAACSAVVMVLGQSALAKLIVDDEAAAKSIALLAIGVVAGVVAAIYLAILQANQRIGDAARVRVWGATAAALVAVGAVAWFGTGGVAAAVISVPIVTFLIAAIYTRRVTTKPPATGSPNEGARSYLWPLLSMGAVLTIAQLIANASALAGRSIIIHEGSLAEAGLFQAATALVAANLSVLLNALSADYFPRLSAAAGNRLLTSDIVNQQTHIVLLLAGPALLLGCLLAEPLLNLLYSSQFESASDLLRLFLAGSVLRLLIWTFGYALTAAGNVRWFLIGETAGVLYVPLVYLLMPSLGLVGVGLASIVGAAATLMCYAYASAGCGVRLSSANLRDVIAIFGCTGITAALFLVDARLAFIVGGGALTVLSWRSVINLRLMLARRSE